MNGTRLEICLLLPDVLGTYSDGGNAVVLAQRAKWRGIPSSVIEVRLGERPPTGCDIYLLGGGEDAGELVAARWLRAQPALRSALGRAQVIAVCAGLQLLGCWLEGADGRRVDGAELLDLTTRPAARRAVGEVDATCTDGDVGRVTGFENHQGCSLRGPSLAPLAVVRSGVGNGDGSDGALTSHVVGTYLHGPVLARNPALADLVLRRATGRPTLEPVHLPDQAAARDLHLLGAADGGSKANRGLPRRLRLKHRRSAGGPDGDACRS